ncbi:hypothetical protein NTHI1209_00305 [Haemophilus influenzae]|uniref:Uncharacterized protein n=1 Tax=Haemophilus influenzae TaxID=727 RepID=A0A158SV09_HAEIF|nr:hypothetical protein NTHI1209_00305 [Haemophilus influenzae]
MVKRWSYLHQQEMSIRYKQISLFLNKKILWIITN